MDEKTKMKRNVEAAWDLLAARGLQPRQRDHQATLDEIRTQDTERCVCPGVTPAWTAKDGAEWCFYCLRPARPGLRS